MPAFKCRYSVVRFVDDPVRDEPRNIGVLLQCPERGYFNGLFTKELRRKLLGIAAPVDIEILDEYIADFSAKFAKVQRWHGASEALFEGPEFLQQDFLGPLSENGFDKVVFTKPRGILSMDPERDLQGLFTRFVETPQREKVGDLEKPVTEAKTYVESIFRERKLLRKGGLRARYPVEVKEHQFKCDFGYRARREVLIEVVDLTSAIFQVRLRHFSPSAIKFKIVKENMPYTSRIALLKTPSHANGDLKIEQNTLRDFATELINLEQEHSKLDQLLERVKRDTAEMGSLFSR